ncbi:MAG TPA: hypothetical protein VJA21_12790 [Verrucomicrobiae bacterium]
MHRAIGNLSQLCRRRIPFRPARADSVALLTAGIFSATVLAAVPAGKPASQHVPQMSYIENQTLRLGVDLNLGGAITYLSPAGTNRELNLINTHDWGRQVQLSYYSGPVPFNPPGTRMSKAWEFIGWNPIQSGDCYGHESRVVKHTNHGRSIYVKCVPMHWPLDNLPGECECEVWLELSGPAVKARCRLTNHRPDKTQYSARHQELPAVYVNGPFYRLMTYTGERPFSGDALTRIEKRTGEPGPWSQWVGTENWAAQVNDAGWGLGVWNPGAFEFTGGFAGRPGAGGPLDDPTGYIAPIRAEILDHNIVYDYVYELILGSLEEVRAYVYQHHATPKLPVFQFVRDRQGWFYRDGTDTGWPIRRQLEIPLEKAAPQVLSPVFLVKAQDAPKLKLEAAFNSGNKDSAEAGVTVFWRRLGQASFTTEQSLKVPIRSDGRFKQYLVDLARSPRYDGLITQLRLDPAPVGQPGSHFRLKSVSFGR